MRDAGLFSFRTMNLGDDMQSYAVLAHLGRVDRLLDRDHLADVPAGDISCVFNSWFLLGDDLRPPSRAIRPLWQGFATTRTELVEGAWLEYLRERPLIGARDRFTTELLQRAGVNARWSGCLTMFLGRALSYPSRPRRGVLFVDVPPSAERLIPTPIVRRAVRVSTFTPDAIVHDPFERWAAVARLLDLMAGAELVVTRRLHAALPAASLGTPVVAIPDPEIAWARKRFAGFEEVIPLAFLDELERDPGVIDWRDIAPARVPAGVADMYETFLSNLTACGLTSPSVRSLSTSRSPLDMLECRMQRLRNAIGGHHPARVRLRLGEWTHELRVLLWSDRTIDVALPGFPGLSKFALTVEGSVAGSPWEPWGRLQELARDQDAPIGRVRGFSAA